MSESAQRLLLWCIAIAVVVGTGVALRYARGYQAVAGIAALGETLPPNVNLRLQKLQVRGRKDNKLAWTMKADRLDTTRLRDRIEFMGRIEAVFIRDNATRARMTADSATYTDAPKVLTVRGNLKAVLRGDSRQQERDLQFQTGQVIWNVGAKQLNCPGKVRLVSGNDFVEGEKLAIDLRTRDYDMKNVSGKVVIDNADPNPLSALPSLRGLTP